jgi:hypothetical protein
MVDICALGGPFVSGVPFAKFCIGDEALDVAI